MFSFIPKTRQQWILLLGFIAVAAIILYFFTGFLMVMR